MERSVEALSPKRIMQLGFAVVRAGGKALTSVGAAKAGEELEIELKDGVIKARVE
jgi:exonuclease VII large subunit